MTSGLSLVADVSSSTQQWVGTREEWVLAGG